MIVIPLSERILINNDWATILFMIAVILIAANRNVFSVRFNEFLKLGYNDKYSKIYKDPNNLLSWFTVSMFFIQLVSYSFFILLILSKNGQVKYYDFIPFIQIITFLFVYLLSKILIEKIAGTTLDSEVFVDQFNLYKINYRSFLALFLLPINVFLYYNYNVFDKYIFTIIIGFAVAYNVFCYFNLIKNYQNLIVSKLFYFILYLCTLEIAPYYFMYYWLNKK
jgi:hypothetical protein